MEKEWFWHSQNISAKLNSQQYIKYNNLFKEFLNKKYNPFKNKQLSIKGISKDDIANKLKELEKYYKEIDIFINKFPEAQRSNLSSRAKLRPTVLEEFCGYLFKDLPEIKKLQLNFYNKGIFAGLGIDENSKTYVKTKDVDFCVGKKLTVDFDGNKQTFIIPIVAIECKTYADKTMFSEAQFTAQTIKRGSPNVRVYVLSERNEIALDEIPAQTPIDQYFVLRKDWESPIDFDVLFDFFIEIRNALKKTSKKLENKGWGRMIIG